MANDVDCFFMYLLTFYTSSFENLLFNLSAHSLIGLFVLLVFKFLSSLYILDMNPLSIEYLANIFSHPVSCLFIISFSNYLFHVQKLFNLMRSYLSILALYFPSYWRPIQKVVTYAYIIISGVILRSLIHLNWCSYRVRDRGLVSVFYMVIYRISASFIEVFPYNICFWYLC
jgi:hypothetical protein